MTLSTLLALLTPPVPHVALPPTLPVQEEWWGRERLTGSWGGLRDRLADRGVELEVAYVRDTFAVVAGGADDGVDSFGFLDVSVGVDLETLCGWEGATFFAQWYAVGGGGIGDEAGDFQGVSNIESNSTHQNAELWLQQALLDGRLELKLGKTDVNSDYAYAENAGEFVNSTFGIAPTIFVAPTFPDPAFALNAFVYPTDDVSVRLGVFDGAAVEGVPTGRRGASTLLGDPADLLLIAEGEQRWSGAHPGRLVVGWWEHTGDFAEFDGGDAEHATGLYGLVDQNLATYDDPRAWGDSLDAFCYLGQADGDVSEVELSLALGVVLSGVLDRPDDAVGLGAAYARFTDEPGAGFGEDAELTLELFWRTQLAPWISLKPDLQYVLAPGGDASLDDALVVGLRLEATL